MKTVSYLCLTFVVVSWMMGCATNRATGNFTKPLTKEVHMFDSSHGTDGFNITEVKDMIEFCVDLDSQDDLQNDLNNAIKQEDSIYNPLINKDRWEIVVDSRELFKSGERQPDKNGFPPFNNAWTLSRLVSAEADKPKIYALAIRGTVMSSNPSVKEDALSTTIAANYGIELPVGSYLPVSFADLPRAEVHAGFAYGAFSALFDGTYGILTNLKKYGVEPGSEIIITDGILTNLKKYGVEPGSEIIITGHSQGAAMATLIHAFFHYAMRDKRFGLGDMNYALKSYVFAQPKPGNNQFSMDFAEIASSRNNAFVLNNTLDSVPQVPLTLQTIDDAVDDLAVVDEMEKMALNALNLLNPIRSLVSSHIADKIARMQTLKTEDLYFAEELTQNRTKNKTEAVSLNYVPAGNIVPLIGDPSGKYYNGQKVDAFIQHHATTYRKLIENIQ
jgi:hypothetical protein